MIVFLICSQGKVFGKEQFKLGDAGGMVQLFGRRATLSKRMQDVGERLHSRCVISLGQHD